MQCELREIHRVRNAMRTKRRMHLDHCRIVRDGGVPQVFRTWVSREMEGRVQERSNNGRSHQLCTQLFESVLTNSRHSLVDDGEWRERSAEERSSRLRDRRELLDESLDRSSTMSDRRRTGTLSRFFRSKNLSEISQVI